MTNGTVTKDQFYIRYDDGNFEAGADTLAEVRQDAREMFDSMKRLWRTVSGIYQNSELIISQEKLDDEFENEDEEQRLAEQSEGSDYDEHGTYWQESAFGRVRGLR